MTNSDYDSQTAAQRDEAAASAPTTYKRTQHPSEAGHWYDREGNPRYTVIGKNGKERPSTIRDARANDWLPSVTSIIRLADRPGLTAWMQRQVVLAALTHPNLTGTDAAVDLILADASEQARKAREKGTEVHAAIQSAYEGKTYATEYFHHVEMAQAAIRVWVCADVGWTAEKSFANNTLGYGGKADLSSVTIDEQAFPKDAFVADIKTTDKPLDTLKTWPEHAWQLAAYREGLGIRNARCAIVYVHVQSGEARVIELPEDELQRGWDCFRALLQFWSAKNRRRT